MTSCRMLAFCPPPNAVDEIAANASATWSSEGRDCIAGALASADIRHGPIHEWIRVFAREDVNVHVLGVLIRRQNAHSYHEALLLKPQLERNLLNAGNQPVPDLRVAKTDVENRGDPFLRDDHDVNLPPLFLTLIDVVTKRKNVFVFVHDLVG